MDGFELPELSEALRAAVEETDKLGEMFEQEFDRTLSRMMLEWCLHKDIRRIAQCLDPHMLGVFVKTVLRLP